MDAKGKGNPMTGIVYDIIFLVILLLATLHGRRQGLVAGLVGLAGAVLGIAVAVWGAGQLGPAIYQDHIGAALGDSVAAALSAQGENLPAILEQYLGFLPDGLFQQVSTALQQAMQASAADISSEVVAALEPILLPLLEAVLFLVLCSVIRWVFRLLAGLLRHLNDLPVLGGVNRVLGLVLGLFTGALDCWMLSLLLWGAAALTGGSVSWISSQALSGSVLYGVFSGLNPFLL